jgi:hypothetical protein
MNLARGSRATVAGICMGGGLSASTETPSPWGRRGKAWRRRTQQTAADDVWRVFFAASSRTSCPTRRSRNRAEQASKVRKAPVLPRPANAGSASRLALHACGFHAELGAHGLKHALAMRPCESEGRRWL